MIFKNYDTFNLALALYHWLQHNWEGQNDPLYADFYKLTAPGIYKPARSEEYFETLENEEYQEVMEVYNILDETNYEEALNLVLKL